MTDISTFAATLGEDGRFVIPAAERRRLGIKAGDTLIAESDGKRLILCNQHAMIRETQEYFRQFIEPGVSVVDDLIAERRAAGAREEQEAIEFVSRSVRD